MKKNQGGHWMLQGEGGHCLHFLNYVTTIFSSEAPPMPLLSAWSLPLLRAPRVKPLPLLRPGNKVFLDSFLPFFEILSLPGHPGFHPSLYNAMHGLRRKVNLCILLSPISCLSTSLTHLLFFLCLPQQWALFFVSTSKLHYILLLFRSQVTFIIIQDASHKYKRIEVMNQIRRHGD